MASLHLAQEIFKLIYPVGSIYLSTSTTNPSTYFGGTWEQVAKEKYLLGYNANNSWFDKPGTSTGSNGNSGGWNTNNHTLTINQIPSHQHYIHGYLNKDYPNFQIVTGQGGSELAASWDSGGTNQHHTNFVGGTQGHNHFHVSPFYVVVVWKRTA